MLFNYFVKSSEESFRHNHIGSNILNYKSVKYISEFGTIIIFLGLLSSSINVFPQGKDLKFEHFTTKDGLSQSTISRILQDREGFMWFGTQNGLNKYDGYTFTNYLPDPDNPASILGNFVMAIFEDRDGVLWIGTEGGLNRYDRNIDGFTHYQNVINDPYSLGGNEVRAILEDNRNNLWIATVKGGLNLYDRANGKFIRYKHDESNPNSLSSDDITAIFEDGRNNLWIGSMHGDLDLFDRDNKTFTHFLYKKKKLTDHEIWNIEGDKEGNIWICTYRSGLYKMFLTDKGDYDFIYYKHDDNNINSISGNAIFTVFEDSKGRLWIGTENEGLNLFDREHNLFTRYRADFLDDKGLNNNSIWAIYEDRTGNLWFGTHAGGINFIPKYGGYFRYYKNNPGDVNSLSHNSVTSFCEDSRNNFWVGTDGGGLNLFNRENETFVCFNRQSTNLGSNSVLSILEDNKGNLWVGTWEGGLNLFNRGSRTFTKYTTENSGLCSNSVFSIFEDSKGVLWIGEFLGGISYFDKDKNDFISYTPENSKLSDDNIRVIMEDSYGNLWIAGAQGLNMFNRETETFTLYNHDDNEKNSLTSGYVLCILESRDSTLWIGTAGGLNKFERNNKNFIQYHVRDGLPNDAIKGIREDNKGNLWLSTNKGLSMFNPESGKFRNYDISDGLQDNEFYQCSHYKTKNGVLYFGGVNGFNSFNPEDIIGNPYIPPIVITDFRIFNKPVPIGKDSPLQAHISETDKIILSYKQSGFSFEFTALNYVSSKKNQYAYKLEGFDKDWNYIGTRHTASYTNIDPGEYTFRVKGSNNDGIWNEEGVYVKIMITPPFWQTWWFKSIITVIVILLLLLIYYMKVNQVRRRNILLEDLVQKRTREINEKNELLMQQTEELNNINALLEERQQQIEEQTDELKAQRDQLSEVNSIKDKLFSIIAHDLKNPFNTIKGFVDLIQSRYDDYTDQERKKMIGIIGNSTDNAYQLLDNLLNWSRSQQGAIQFKPKMVNIVQMIEEDIALIKNQAENKNIRIEFESSSRDITLMIDKDIMNIVIRNLLTNAIKYSILNGEIKLNCVAENSTLLISIKDNGIGISEEDKEKLFKSDVHFSTRGTNNETGTGLGLILCKELIEKHQGKIWLESELQKGTTFFISLPINKTGTDLIS